MTDALILDAVRWATTYHQGSEVRLWDNQCFKHVALPDTREATLLRYKRTHRCGPIESPWQEESAGNAPSWLGRSAS